MLSYWYCFQLTLCYDRLPLAGHFYIQLLLGDNYLDLSDGKVKLVIDLPSLLLK